MSGFVKNLPKTWEMTILGEAYQVIGGGTPSTEISDYWGGAKAGLLRAGKRKGNYPLVRVTKRVITSMTSPSLSAHISFWGVAFPLLVLMGFLSGQNKAFAQTTCTIPGTVTSCHKLVSELPWQFNIEEKENHRILFQSLKGKRQPGIPLKIFLAVTSHVSQEAAEASFSQINKDANPDTGISYAWDLVMLREKRIFHLHADCTLAERHFESLVHTLAQIAPTSGKHPSHALFCRCGGGCKPFEKNESQF